MLERLSRVKKDLGVAVDALVELLVRIGSTLKGQVMRDHERRLGASSDDEIPQVAVVFL